VKAIRTLVVDDNAPFREALRFFLEEQADIELVGMLSEGTHCLTYMKKHPVDVVIMDARMPGIDGPEATQQLKREHTNVKVVMCTIWDDRELKNYAKQAGADAYFVKGEPLTTLLKKIRRFFPRT
jgi:DNA-binding NarL/FixJ family response regulator